MKNAMWAQLPTEEKQKQKQNKEKTKIFKYSVPTYDSKSEHRAWSSNLNIINVERLRETFRLEKKKDNC